MAIIVVYLFVIVRVGCYCSVLHVCVACVCCSVLHVCCMCMFQCVACVLHVYVAVCCTG